LFFAHKFGGPKGVGILLVKNNTPIEYSQLGGEQETKRRAGMYCFLLIKYLHL
jgi:cysteine desulfurase